LFRPPLPPGVSSFDFLLIFSAPPPAVVLRAIARTFPVSRHVFSQTFSFQQTPFWCRSFFPPLTDRPCFFITHAFYFLGFFDIKEVEKGSFHKAFKELSLPFDLLDRLDSDFFPFLWETKIAFVTPSPFSFFSKTPPPNNQSPPVSPKGFPCKTRDRVFISFYPS